MKFQIQVICQDDSGDEQHRQLMELSRDELIMETLGLTLVEGKQLLHDLQRCVVDRQAAAYLEQHRRCPQCDHRFVIKAQGSPTVNTIYGPCAVANPRWRRCRCQRIGAKTFRPTAAWMTDRSSPELLYLETKWASLIPYARVVDLLGEVLPVSKTLNPQTVSNHLHATAQRLEQRLGDEGACLFSGNETDWAAQPLPDGR